MHAPNEFHNVLQDWVEAFMRRSMRNFMLFLKESGLSMSQMGALFHVNRKGSCGVSDIGDNLGITSAAASQMIERLVQQDLISRVEDPADRRLKQIDLTEKGRKVIQESMRARQLWLEDLVEMLTPAEQDKVVAALRILIEKTHQLEKADIAES
jgi:DNA-binding MarR family transcriptional regulator